MSENGQSQTAGRGTQGATTGLLAVVPVRAGSRGVPRKNMAIVAGVPLVEYAVAAALAAEPIGAVVVTSDDEEILERYARRDGVLVLRRPPDLATDTASSADTVAHALEQWEAAGGWSPHALIMVQATTPLRTSADIDAAYDLFTRSGSEAVISACRVDGIRHPRVMYRLRDDGRSELFMTDPTDRDDPERLRAALPEQRRRLHRVDRVFSARTPAPLTGPGDLRDAVGAVDQHRRSRGIW